MRKIMKQLLLLSIILAALSTPAQADTVNIEAVATDVLRTYGSFAQTPGGTPLSSNGAIETIISSNPDTAIYGLSNPISDTNPQENWVSVDLGFGDNTVITGSGVDLVIFSLWSGDSYSFGLQAFDNKDLLTGETEEDHLLSNYNYTVTSSTTAIDLFKDSTTALEDNIELGYIRLFIGNDYNGATSFSNFSLVGAVHTQATVVPLPLPAVLFSSGLALLGWIGRRKKL